MKQFITLLTYVHRDGHEWLEVVTHNTRTEAYCHVGSERDRSTTSGTKLKSWITFKAKVIDAG